MTHLDENALLRSQLAELEVSLQALKEENMMLRDAVAEERAAVVAWLRAECRSPGHEDRFCAYCNVRRNIAAEVERGVHREPEEYAIGYNVWGEKK